MRSLLLFAFLLNAANCIAQQRTIGLRQGVGFWLNATGYGKGSLRYASGQHFTWDKEVFLRMPLNKKWQTETALLYYTFNNRIREQAGAGNYLHSDVRNRLIELRLSVQHDVTYPLFAYLLPQLSGMRSYVGLELAPRLSFNNVTSTTGVAHNRKASALLQFSYTHLVPLGKRCAITSVLSFGTVPFGKWQWRDENNPPNRRIGLRTGMGYRF